MAIALGLYVATLMPGMAFDDWGEMQSVPHVLGVAHPTGYPTYLLTAWLFELLPIGSVAWRANLLSAVLRRGRARQPHGDRAADRRPAVAGGGRGPRDRRGRDGVGVRRSSPR